MSAKASAEKANANLKSALEEQSHLQKQTSGRIEELESVFLTYFYAVDFLLCCYFFYGEYHEISLTNKYCYIFVDKMTIFPCLCVSPDNKCPMILFPHSLCSCALCAYRCGDPVELLCILHNSLLF